MSVVRYYTAHALYQDKPSRNCKETNSRVQEKFRIPADRLSSIFVDIPTNFIMLSATDFSSLKWVTNAGEYNKCYATMFIFVSFKKCFLILTSLQHAETLSPLD